MVKDIRVSDHRSAHCHLNLLKLLQPVPKRECVARRHKQGLRGGLWGGGWGRVGLSPRGRGDGGGWFGGRGGVVVMQVQATASLVKSSLAIWAQLSKFVASHSPPNNERLQHATGYRCTFHNAADLKVANTNHEVDGC